ncbi:hypothetical protein Tco_0222914 [Tanacetum coccineum]
MQSAVEIVIQQHEQAVQKKQEERAAFTPYWKFPIFDDDDDEYTIQYKEYLKNLSNAITPDLSTEEPDNSLSMEDEHLDTIPETESDEVVKSSVEDLVPIPSESEGIFDNMCDVPFCDKNHFYAEYHLLESLLNRDTSIVYSPKIDSLLEEFAGELALINPIPSGIHEADFDPKEDIRLIEQFLEEVKDDILREKLLNIYLLIAKIESLTNNPTPDCMLKSPSPFLIPVEDCDSFFKKSDTSLSYSDISLPEFETFSYHTEETSSGSTTTHADNSLPEYDSFLFETEPDQGELTSVVMEDILGEPHVSNVLPNHPTLYLDSDFAPFDDSLEPDLVVSFPSGTRNKIFNPGIFIEVQSMRFLSPNEFSISFIRDPLYLVFDTLLPFSSENEEKVFNPGSLSSNKEKSPHLLSHRGFNPSKIISDFSESPLMISREDIPILDVPRKLNLDSTKDLPPSPNVNPLSGSTTSSSPSLTTSEFSDYSLEEFADELALIESFPLENDDMAPEDVIREIEYLINSNPLYSLNNDHIYTIPEMFIDEHTLDYSSHPRYDDDLFDLKTDNDEWGKIFYDDPFDSKENKIKVSKLLVDELDSTGSSSFLPHFLECDPVLYGDFSEVDTLTSTDNEDKVFNAGILIHENLYEVTNRVTPDTNVKKISSSNASLILEDYYPPLSDHELPFHIEIPGSETLLSFSSYNEEKIFNPGILISKGVHSLLPELSHRDSKAFKVINIFEIPMEIFPCSYGEDIRVLDVPCIEYSLKDKNEAKTDKTEHGNRKSVKKSKVKLKSQQVKDGAETEEILNGPTRTHLMGRVSPIKNY